MSALLPHAKAARLLAEAFSEQAAECGDEANALILARMAAAYAIGARKIADAALAELGVADGESDRA